MVLMNCGMSRSGVSVRVAVDVESVLKPWPSGGAVTFTSGSVCDCCASAGPVPDSMRITAAAIGRFLKRHMGLPLVVALSAAERACWAGHGGPLAGRLTLT